MDLESVGNDGRLTGENSRCWTFSFYNYSKLLLLRLHISKIFLKVSCLDDVSWMLAPCPNCPILIVLAWRPVMVVQSVLPWLTFSTCTGCPTWNIIKQWIWTRWGGQELWQLQVQTGLIGRLFQNYYILICTTCSRHGFFYIRGWMQMVLAPNDLFSWNNKYNKYTNTMSPTHSHISSWAMHVNLLCACSHLEAMKW